MIAHSVHGASSLEALPFFRSGLLSAGDKQALAAIAAPPRSLKAGVDLVNEGVPADTVYFLTQGWACRQKTTSGGARQITGMIVLGDACNLDSYMLAHVNFGVRTLAATTVVGLPRAALQVLAAERPGIARALTLLAIMENAVLCEWALSLGQQRALERLARFLCEMAVRLDGESANRAMFDLPLTQEQIADVLGITAIHANRTIQQLRAEGLLVIRARHVTLPDVAELCRVAGFDRTYLDAAPSMVSEQERAEVAG